MRAECYLVIRMGRKTEGKPLVVVGTTTRPPHLEPDQFAIKLKVNVPDRFVESRFPIAEIAIPGKKIIVPKVEVADAGEEV